MSLRTFRFLIQICLLSQSSFVNATAKPAPTWDCGPAQWMIKGETTKSTRETCRQNSTGFITSPDCRSDCPLVRRLIDWEAKGRRNVVQTFGTPSSLLCHELKGIPYFVNVTKNGATALYKLCVDSETGSFLQDDVLQMTIRRKMDEKH